MIAFLAILLLQEKAMSDDELKRRCEATWDGMRAALRDYRLDDLKKLVDLPADLPVPPRAQARAIGENLPDLAKNRFLKFVREKDRIGYVCAFEPDGGKGTGVAVVRFRTDGRLVGGMEMMSIYETDEKADPERLLATQPMLRLFPPPFGEAPATPEDAAGDARPEPVIRKELEGVWKRVRDAWAAGTPEKADEVQIWEGDKRPSPDEARAAARERMPDLSRARFIKLVWSERKPHLAGYVAEVNVGNAKKTTLAMIVFARQEGVWKFVPGPASIEAVELPPTGQAKQKQVVESDPRFKLD